MNLRQRLIRILPPFRGKFRFARFLIGPVRGPAVVKDQFGFSYEVPDLREPIAFNLLVNGVYEPKVEDLILNTLKPGDVFIDVGANIGVFTIPAAKRVGSGGRVIAVEASPDVFGVLERNIAVNDSENVHLICAAAAASEGESQFYPAPVDHFGMGSRAPQFNVAPITVSRVMLDSLMAKFNLSSVAVLKIDVEGFEIDVLKGATRLLTAARPPLVIFEFCDWAEARAAPENVGAAQRFLFDYGFRIWRAANYNRGNSLTNPLTDGAEILVAFKG
jgi:FkbM family methyltransferase